MEIINQPSYFLKSDPTNTCFLLHFLTAEPVGYRQLGLEKKTEKKNQHHGLMRRGILSMTIYLGSNGDVCKSNPE